MKKRSKQNLINIKKYVEYALENGRKLTKCKKFELLSDLVLDKSGAYPMVIATDQNGKKVKIGATFIKLYYEELYNKIYLYKSPTFSSMQVTESLDFYSSEGKFTHLEPGDYILIDNHHKISGISKAEYKDNFITASTYTRRTKKVGAKYKADTDVPVL